LILVLDDKNRRQQMLNESVFANNQIHYHLKIGDLQNPSEYHVNIANKLKKFIEK